MTNYEYISTLFQQAYKELDVIYKVSQDAIVEDICKNKKEYSPDSVYAYLNAEYDGSTIRQWSRNN